MITLNSDYIDYAIAAAHLVKHFCRAGTFTCTTVHNVFTTSKELPLANVKSHFNLNCKFVKSELICTRRILKCAFYRGLLCIVVVVMVLLSVVIFR